MQSHEPLPAVTLVDSRGTHSVHYHRSPQFYLSTAKYVSLHEGTKNKTSACSRSTSVRFNGHSGPTETYPIPYNGTIHRPPLLPPPERGITRIPGRQTTKAAVVWLELLGLTISPHKNYPHCCFPYGTHSLLSSCSSSISPAPSPASASTRANWCMCVCACVCVWSGCCG